MTVRFSPLSAGPNFTVFQGEDKSLVIPVNLDLTTYTEIEFIIDASKQITRKLSRGEISAVTATQFQVSVGDVSNTPAGEYRYQIRATDAGGSIQQAEIRPSRISVKHSAFVNPNSGNDYNG